MILLLVALMVFQNAVIFVTADNIDDQISQLKKDIDNLSQELQRKEADYQQLNEQLISIKNRLIIVDNEIAKKKLAVAEGEKALDYQKKLLNERARNYYKNINKNTTSLINLLSGESFQKSLENFFYQKTVVDEDRRTIIKIVLYVKDLEEKKRSLEIEQTELSKIKQQVLDQSLLLKQEITQTREKIASLTERQQQLIAQKLSSLNISRSALTIGRCDSDLTNNRDPGFSPRFAAFTYGVPNRVGLNQYGAYGRARASQDMETILRAYYNFDELRSVDTGIRINVEGYGDYSLEEYMKRIYEVPDQWGNEGGYEALKAQAVAARSYALAYTNMGQGQICSSENCQVFKPEPKGGNWERAVNETAGKAMFKAGVPIKAWYSSTHGGYIFSSGEIGWSATDWTKHGIDAANNYSGFSDLQTNAYDRDSPWFYCDWGWRPEHNNTAWLKPDELADIVNVVLLARLLSAEDKEHLYQTDRPSPAGKEIWDKNRVIAELKNRNEQAFDSINEAAVNVDFGFGKTTSVVFTGNSGTVTIDGNEFKNWFNLRAPANIQIVGPLYNIEKRG